MENNTTSEKLQKTADQPSESVSVVEHVEGLVNIIDRVIDRLTSTWSLYQLAIIIALLITSWLLYLALRRPIRTMLKRLLKASKPILRISILINKRMTVFLFICLSWSTYHIMQMITWPSRSYFISIAASLATAFFTIAILSSLIRNRTLRKIIAWVAWSYTFMIILGIWDSIRQILDAIAIDTGGIRISVMMVITAAITLGVLFALANLLNRTITRRIESAKDMSPSIKALLNKTLKIFLYTGAVLFALRAVGFDLSNLALLSGAIGLGIGFGLQKIVSNLISGIIILLDKSIKPGDVISLEGTFGWITELGARYASITTRDGREYLVPNEDFITNQVVNWSHSFDYVRLDINFGASYECDPHVVRKVAAAAPLTVSRILKNPPPVCHVINFGNSSVDYKLRFWINDPSLGLTNIRGQVHLALWDALKDNNISIPYPRRDVYLFNDNSNQPAAIEKSHHNDKKS